MLELVMITQTHQEMTKTKRKKMEVSESGYQEFVTTIGTTTALNPLLNPSTNSLNSLKTTK